MQKKTPYARIIHAIAEFCAILLKSVDTDLAVKLEHL